MFKPAAPAKRAAARVRRKPSGRLAEEMERACGLAVSASDGGGFEHGQALAVTRRGGGLGLMSARARVDFICGEMHVDSRRGKGTTVTVIAPLLSASAEPGQ